MMPPSPPNILFLMTDQQRFDTIAALGNSLIYTPNLDRLVERGIAFTNAYSLAGEIPPRPYLVGMHEEPGTPHFKIMVRSREWKYIYMANGDRTQLFNLIDDPHEHSNRIAAAPEIAGEMHGRAVDACHTPGASAALDSGGLRAFPFRQRPLRRIYQFDRSRGVTGFPENPAGILRSQG